MEHEENQLSETIERHKAQVDRVEEVARAVDYMEMHKPGSAAPTSLDMVIHQTEGVHQMFKCSSN